MNKERRRVGRRSVVRNLVKLTPEYDNEKKMPSGPKKSLFSDDTSFVMRRTLKPLHEINNFQFSSAKSKSHEKLYEENTFDIPKSTFMEMFNDHNKMPLSPPSRTKILEASMKKNRKEPNEPIIQSQELFHTLIDSPCTKYEKVKFNNALSSATRYLLNRHLESVVQNPEVLVEPEIDLPPTIENNFNELKTQSLINVNNTPKQDISQSNNQTQVSKYLPLTIEDIEELKTKEIVDIRQSKLNCCELIKNRFREIELEIEKNFSIMESQVINNYDILLKKVQDDQNDSSESQTSNITVETVKEKNYTRMTGAFGILNNLNTECSFLKTPKTKGKTREEMLNKGTLTPGTMSFVLQEQLMHLNSSS